MNTTISPVLCPDDALAGATPTDYQLPIVATARVLARGWLWLGLLALIGAGVFSVLLVFARTPVINTILPGADFFHTALVVHVDLSVLVWFVSIAGVLWTVDSRPGAAGLGWIALGGAAFGTAMMVLAPFVDPGKPVMANYVPVIESKLFLAGLIVFALGAAALVARVLITSDILPRTLDGAASLRFGLFAAAVATAVALVAFSWSIAVLPRSLDSETYWEILFWGGGHALQYVWTILLLVAWLWLAQACGAVLRLSARVTLLLFCIAVAPVFITPYAYLAHDIVSVEHRHLHTLGMRVGGGMAIFPIALAVLLALTRLRSIPAEGRPLRATLIASMSLFAAGGIIGMAIDGNNVKIPAHYHGCIVGVTLAMMGLVYYLLPRLGYGAPRGSLAVRQPYIYGLGQLMHIVGLVWSGGYGVQRKVAGADQVLRSSGEVWGMGLMGLGGLVAIIGGLLFVLIVWRELRRGHRG